MKIQNIQASKMSFKRAFSTNERRSYERLLDDSKKALGLKDTTAVIFDFNVPSEKGKNTGIGSLWSKDAQKFTEFLKANTLITSIQTGPEGKITNENRSPYSGTNFTLGEHIIDLNKLTSYDYAKLLSEEDLQKVDAEYPGDKNAREYKTDYDYVIDGKNGGKQEELLKKAYDNYIYKIKDMNIFALNLRIGFREFKKENADALEKEFIYYSLSKDYGTADSSRWSKNDRNLFSPEVDEKTRSRRVSFLERRHEKEKDYLAFKQFLAAKQQNEARKNFNDMGIKLYGDCLIGYSESEVWAHPECFTPGLYYGGPDPACSETNNIQTWQLTAPDFRKTGECDTVGDLSQLGETGKFFYDKYKTFFKRYDGVRTDAAWQFITPFIYRENNGNYEQVELPEMNKTMFNIMKTAAKDVLGDKFDENNPENIMLELVGLSAGKSREMTLNEYPHLYTTAYSQYDEYPAAFKKKGYSEGMFYAGVGCHDNESLVEQSRDKEKRDIQMPLILDNYSTDPGALKFTCNEYTSLSDEEKAAEDFRTAKFSEIFTGTKQFFTLPDMFGMSERINISGKVSPDNWCVRIPSDYEKFYHLQLSNGYGLNMPKALANAMIMTGKGDEKLISKCLEAAEILRSKGALTREEADNDEAAGKLKSSFTYTA